nr:ribonuclease H-like domain-containing protein [Tanacetum cinerariifolium]
MEQPNPTFAKIPILNTGKFEQWKFSIQQYLQNEHYALWAVIEFSDSYQAPPEETCKGSASESSTKKKGRTIAITTEDIQKRRNDVKARTTLLLALPDEHQLRFSKLQAIVSNLEFMDVEIEQDDLNQKFLTSLAPEWLILKSKRSQRQTLKIWLSFLHQTPEVEKINEDDIEEMDIKWNMALLSMQADRFWKKTGKKITIQGSDVAGFDKSKVKCFNCHKMGYFARECRAPRSQDRGKRESYRQGPNEEEQAPKALMAINGIRWDWSYMANEEENHALVADVEVPTEFALMPKSSLSLKNEVYDDSYRFKSCRKNTENLNTKISKLSEKLSDCETGLYHYKRGLERDVEVRINKIKHLMNELEQVKKEKEGLDNKLTGFESTLKDLDTILGSQRTDKNKEGLPEFVDDIVTDYSRPSPSIDSSKSNTSDLQNSNSSVSEHGESSDSIMKSPVKYAEMYRSTSKSPKVRGNQRYWDSGCSRHMTGIISYLFEYEPYDGGYVSFGQGGGKITGKGIIKTSKLEFKNVYFAKELKYNLFSVSQIYDNKNSVLFNDSECIVLGKDFKLKDDTNVLLKTPRQHNMYSIDLNNVVPHKNLTCLVAKASIDESMLWHRRLGHLNFKTMNKLVRNNLVKGLPSKCFENDHTCVACLKGKQHKASCKTKLVNYVFKPLHTLHMDLFGPTSVSSLNHKWNFITKIENLKDLKNEHYALWEVTKFDYSYKAPQEEAASEIFVKKKGRTIVITIEDMQKRRNDVKARTTLLLALPDEHYGKGEVHTASVSIASTQVSTASTDVAAASISHDTVCAYIASQSNGSQIKYEDITQIDEDEIKEIDIKASRSQDRGRRESYKQGPKEEEQAPKALMAIDGIGWDWSYMANEEENHALVADDEAPTKFALMAKSSSSSDNEVKKEKEGLDSKLTGFKSASKDLDTLLRSQRTDKNKEGLGYSVVPPFCSTRTMLVDAKLPVTFWAEAVNTACYVQNRVLVNKSQNKTPYELFNSRTHAIGFLRSFRCHVMILNTLDHLGKFDAKGDEDACNADAPESSGISIPTATSKIPPADQMETLTVESVIPTEESKKIFDALKDPSWVEAMQEELLQFKIMFGFRLTVLKGKHRGDFLLVQVYVDDIIFRSSNPQLCKEFEALMHEKFQMSAMGELNFFLGLQVLQKKDGIFLSQDKFVRDILKKFGYSDVRSANTPMDKENP